MLPANERCVEESVEIVIRNCHSRRAGVNTENFGLFPKLGVFLKEYSVGASEGVHSCRSSVRPIAP